jgi:hypothetical protein
MSSNTVAALIDQHNKLQADFAALKTAIQNGGSAFAALSNLNTAVNAVAANTSDSITLANN